MATIVYKDVPFYVEGKEEGIEIGLIVIQEWWGLSGHIKRTTKKFADALNAWTISPDLYRGKCTDVADEANHLMDALDWPQAVQDVQFAAEYLKSKGCKKIGVVGFCMGGALSIASCTLKPDFFDAGVCFYGIPPAAFADPVNLKVPMQFHFGNLDQSKGFSDKEAADNLKAKLQGKDFEMHQYDNADHAFMNEDAPAYPYNPEIAKLAFNNTITYFKKKLSA